MKSVSTLSSHIKQAFGMVRCRLKRRMEERYLKMDTGMVAINLKQGSAKESDLNRAERGEGAN